MADIFFSVAFIISFQLIGLFLPPHTSPNGKERRISPMLAFLFPCRNIAAEG
ncbi:hypothetical protein [Akkermansia glycaniphila]|uniref:hypothetical protein n=1 Tax=Akkermansia glycaniphila TaxID=1679444 RepID=UPI00159EBF45|nr:hypothetical protein [Akkermansia glycaniphila]